MSFITLEEVNKEYHDGSQTLSVLRDLSLQIKKGDMVSIMGRSGSGKTTLMHILAGLIPINSGRYIFEQRTLDWQSERVRRDFRNTHIGYITQNTVLLDDRNVAENIVIPLSYSSSTKKEMLSKVESIADLLNIKPFIYQNVSRLSGGERQRVAIARAIIKDQAILLADEPTGSLDEKSEAEILSIFSRLNAQGRTIVIITHDKAVADSCTTHYRLLDGLLHQE